MSKSMIVVTFIFMYLDCNNNNVNPLIPLFWGEALGVT